MQPTRLPLMLLFLVLLNSAAPTISRGQAQATGGANADIFKMIQADLPESSIVDKINAAPGRWDTSIDALIALKRAGATSAEIKALTATVSSSSLSAPAPPPLVETPFMGGVIVRPNGRILLIFASSPARHATARDRTIGPNPQLTFDVVLVDGHPALRLPVEGYFFQGKGFGTYHDEFGDLLITHDRLTYRPYAEGEAWKPAPWNPFSEAPPIEILLADVIPKENLKAFGPNHDWLGTDFAKKGSSWDLNLGRIFEKKDHTPQGDFLLAAFSNFDATMSALLEAARGNDPSTPISPWPYTPPTAQQVNLFVQAHNAGIGPQAPKSGNSWLSAMNALQGIANIQQSMADAKVADASGSGAAQLNVALNAGKNEIAALDSVSNPTAALAPVAPINLPQPIAPSQPAAAKAPTAKAHFTYNPSKPAAATTPKTSVNTGTVAPANCVATNVEGPCVPLSQYSQTQQQATLKGSGICPASGFVPGVALHIESDLAVGVPCKPGTPYGPLIATTASGGFTGVTPPDPVPASGGSGSLQGGGSAAGSGSGDPSDAVLNSCIALSYKSDSITGTHLIIQNNCSIAAHVLFYASSQVNGGVHLSPGDSTNTYQPQDKIQAAGGVSIYACPEGDIPREADGTLAYNGVNNQFRCSRK